MVVDGMKRVSKNKKHAYLGVQSTYGVEGVLEVISMVARMPLSVT